VLATVRFYMHSHKAYLQVSNAGGWNKQ